MIIINANTENGGVLPIGRVDEDNAREVWFDLSYMIKNVGEGTAEVVHQRSSDKGPYLVRQERRGQFQVWIVQSEDLAFKGFGKCELRWRSGDSKAKTVIYRTNVLESLTGEETIPDPYQSWYDLMIDYIDRLKVDSDAKLAEAVENASESADTATTAAGEAAQSAQEAEQSASEAMGSATVAGRFASNAQEFAGAAAASAEAAEQSAAQAGYMFFYIDDDGDLHYQRTENVKVDFYLHDGDLMVRAGS